ncbi:MAG TPA: hypothetical protein VFH68_10770 [Polyangia bacterium]|nr:hypothetical protein [Polyangia bacterium]
MSTDTPPPGSAPRGLVRSASRRPERPLERSYLSLVPRRNLLRALFLLLALLAVVALKKSGGGFFRNVLDSVAPPRTRAAAPPRPPTPETTVHLQLQAPPR